MGNSNLPPKVINGTDNAETLTGTSNIDHIYGFGGNDTIYGLEGDDLLFGGAGNDRLDGGTGMDTMYGGAGSDDYYVDNPGDVVSEEIVAGTDDGGTDAVHSSISFKLGKFVEKLTLTGTSNLSGAGNELANTIKGNSGANVLSGGAGNDTLYGYEGDDILIGGAGKDYLYGGSGADTFVFSPGNGSTDRVYDFEAVDRIGIYAAEFGLSVGKGLLSTGALDPNWFVAGTAANKSGHGQFVYDAAKLTLYWDPDGTGSKKPQALSTFNTGTTLSADRFVVFTTPPTVSIAAFTTDPQPEEGGASYAVVTLSAPWYQNITVTYSTVDGTAVGGSDFTKVTNGTITIAAGETTAYIRIDLLDDSVVEQLEQFSVRIDSANVASTGTPLAIGTASASITICDDDTGGSPPPGPSGPPEPPAPPVAPTVVRITNTWELGIPDPSGIAYDPTSKKLFLSDSEIDEAPFLNNTNLFRSGLDGTLEASYTPSYTKEPTGLAIDAARNLMYVSDDQKDKVFVVSLSAPQTLLWSFDTRPFGSYDPEDVAFDPVTGNIFVVDGALRSIYELALDHTTRTAMVVNSFTLPDAAIQDPEALAFDPVHNVLLVGGAFSASFWIVDRTSGSTLQKIDLLVAYRNDASGTGTTRTKVKDIELAPASDGTGATHIYVADYGGDQIMDGRIIEINPGTMFDELNLFT